MEETLYASVDILWFSGLVVICAVLCSRYLLRIAMVLYGKEIYLLCVCMGGTISKEERCLNTYIYFVCAWGKPSMFQ